MTGPEHYDVANRYVCDTGQKNASAEATAALAHAVVALTSATMFAALAGRLSRDQVDEVHAEWAAVGAVPPPPEHGGGHG